MPELPEVETVKEVLKSWIVGKKIKRVFVLYPPIVENVSEAFLNETLVNQEVEDIQRKGKFLIILLSQNVLISHLRMEGKYYFGQYGEEAENTYTYLEGSQYPKNKHVHFIIQFADDTILLYHDVRKFGRIQLRSKEDYQLTPSLHHLGEDANITKISAKQLYAKIHPLKRSIKQVLLDQTILAGLGNIYVDECCFLAKIRPTRKASTIKIKECQALLDAAKFVLERAISLGGSTIRSYHFANDVDGKFQNLLAVYGREGKPCRNCGNPISKIKHGGRGTHYCPNCQK